MSSSEELYPDKDSEHNLVQNNIYNAPRSLALAQLQVEDWKNDKTRTSFIVVALCLNIGTEPPDLFRPEDTKMIETGIDPFEDIDETDPKLLDSSNYIEDEKGNTRFKTPIERIADNIIRAYSNISKAFDYKFALDPIFEEAHRVVTHARKQAREDRILFHYNGHGVPKPSDNGDVWLFNKSFSQYIPLSPMEISSWARSPTIYVWDIQNSEVVINAFHKAAKLKHAEVEMLYSIRYKKQHEKNPNEAPQNVRIPRELKEYFFQDFHFGPTKAGEKIPLVPGVPTDLFTACLTNPVETALRFYATQKGGILKELFDKNLDFPGNPRDRRTPLGELTWILTSITDSIAWDIFSRAKFRQLFRQDVMIASLCRNFILANRILHHYGCHTVSYPPFPPTHLHKQWEIWDLEVGNCVQQLPKLVKELSETPPEGVSNTETMSFSQDLTIHSYAYKQSNYFNNCLDAFNIWLHHAKWIVINHLSVINPLSSKPDEHQVEGRRVGGLRSLSLGPPSGLEPPKQLPVVLQVLLSQNYRHNALALLYNFLLLGPWAVDLIFAIGISPFIVKLLGTASNEITGLLILVWSKLVAGDPSCLVELLKNDGYRYFINYLGQTASQSAKLNPNSQSASNIANLNENSESTRPNTNILSIYKSFSHKFDLNNPQSSDPPFFDNLKNLNIVTTSAFFVLSMFCGINKSAQHAVYRDETLNYIIIHLQRPDDGSKELTQLKIWALLLLSNLLDDFLEAQWTALNYKERVNATKNSQESTYRTYSIVCDSTEYSRGNFQDLQEDQDSIEIRDISEILVSLSFHNNQGVRTAALNAIGSLLKGLNMLIDPQKTFEDPLIDKLVDLYYSKPKQPSENDSASFKSAKTGNQKSPDPRSKVLKLGTRSDLRPSFQEPFNQSRPNSLPISEPEVETNDVIYKVRSTEFLLWTNVMYLATDGSPMVRREVVNVLGKAVCTEYMLEMIRAVAIISIQESNPSNTDLIELIYPEGLKPRELNDKEFLEPTISTSSKSVSIELMLKVYKALLALSCDPHLDVSRSAMKVVDTLFQAFTRSAYFMLFSQSELSAHISSWAKKSNLSSFAPPTLTNQVFPSEEHLKKTKQVSSKSLSPAVPSIPKTKSSSNLTEPKTSVTRTHSFSKVCDAERSNSSHNILKASKLNSRALNLQQTVRSANLSAMAYQQQNFEIKEGKTPLKASKPKISISSGDESSSGYNSCTSNPNEMNDLNDRNQNSDSRNNEFEEELNRKQKLISRVGKVQTAWIIYSIKKLVSEICVSEIFDWEGSYFLESELLNSAQIETNDEILKKLERKRNLKSLVKISTSFSQNCFNKTWVNKRLVIPKHVFYGPTQIKFHPTVPHLIVATQDGRLNVIDYDSKTLISRYQILNTASEIYSPVKDIYLINPENRTMMMTVTDDGVANVYNGYAPSISKDGMAQHQSQLLENNFDLNKLSFVSPKLIMTFRAVPFSFPKRRIQQVTGAGGQIPGKYPSLETKISQTKSLKSGGSQIVSEQIEHKQSIGCGISSDFNQYKGYLFAGSESTRRTLVWNLETEQIVNSLTSKSVLDGITTVSSSKDGNMVVTGNFLGVLRIYDVRMAQSESLVQVLRNSRSDKIVASYYMDSIENRIYTASIDGRIVAYDTRMNKELFKFKKPSRKPSDNIIKLFKPQKRSVFLTACSNYTLNLYNSEGTKVGVYNSFEDQDLQNSLLSSIKSNFSMFGGGSEGSDYEYSDPSTKLNLGELVSNANDSTFDGVNGINSLVSSLNQVNHTNPHTKALENYSYLSVLDNLTTLSSNYDILSAGEAYSAEAKDYYSMISAYGYRPEAHNFPPEMTMNFTPADYLDPRLRHSNPNLPETSTNSQVSRLKPIKNIPIDLDRNEQNQKQKSISNTRVSSASGSSFLTEHDKFTHRLSANMESTYLNSRDPALQSMVSPKRLTSSSSAYTPTGILGSGYNKQASNGNINCSKGYSLPISMVSLDENSISALAFHPYIPTVAMALEDGSIYFCSSS
ncbi:hypothetical protein BB560_002823 [Smittium megazygosporum]|uniref:Raptor N-terminal CASPase-like domain-containing protein n=1 Tax=Smittium megazygosporum TaxID=133381 RepID=A0A2T9ZDN7_9FUNG|nr:hypothetical protein BB560_002823 [Smittium megazygosporum]